MVFCCLKIFQGSGFKSCLDKKLLNPELFAFSEEGRRKNAKVPA